MISTDWLCGQIAFIYAFNKVKPAQIVDKLVEIAVDIMVPGRGAGEGNWRVLLNKLCCTSQKHEATIAYCQIFLKSGS
ncbi:hypothetical protein ACHAWX_001976 [Stephanocyclus meneghinianus]